MPLISVIIPTFNRVDVLYRSIHSVLHQTYRDIEIIVVDDGSTDATPDLVLSIVDDRTMYVRQKHLGVSAARNRGISASSGKLIAFLDSDDEWRSDKLEKQLELYGGNNDFICHTDELWLKDDQAVNQKNIHKKQGGCFFERALERCLISPSSVLISRSLLDKVGYFDENLLAAEDYDLWLRITAFYPVTFVDQPLVIKYGGRLDQLSVTTQAIDRYRIEAILNILRNPDLRPDYRVAAVGKLTEKCEILAKGLEKGERQKNPKGIMRSHDNISMIHIRPLEVDLKNTDFYIPSFDEIGYTSCIYQGSRYSEYPGSARK